MTDPTAKPSEGDESQPKSASESQSSTSARPSKPGDFRIKIGSQRDRENQADVAGEGKPEEPAEMPEAPAPQPLVAASHGGDAEAEGATVEPPAEVITTFPPPRLRRVSEDLQREIDDALADVSLDDLMAGTSDVVAKIPEPQLESRYRGIVMKIARDNIFISLPGHYEGVANVKQFDELPEPGTALDVVVTRFNREDNLYEVSVPGASVQVADWSDIQEGVVVEARVTGHNAGGLECEVNGIRAFMPVSQITLYRVEDLEQFVDQKFPCVVTEANPARRNLVLSRRALLEREREESRENLLNSLEVGQVHQGVVRSVRDFGAFVDLGGVDGLIHVSKLSWGRVNHPSEVLEEGQRVEVRIEKIDREANRIGLSYRDLQEDPWSGIDSKYPVNATVTGKVSKIMDFGAFVELEPGVEGLVHISELAHHRVTRVNSVVQEGQDVAVKVLSVDPQTQRISLSIKQTQASPAAVKADAEEEAADEPQRESVVPQRNEPLRGGTNRKTGGDQFGLNW
ncbi:MAG: S1 RNA-binding domain-containing protein [Planctomycetales bacterium]|nr:S1 RNA-binding domain-containing protein [Planctomycetales bacterium]